ncbi:MAG: HAD family hydrolase [Anaerolineae bacterium]|nr:HAD family hydrolase [Anaerolineae bacterium]
MITLDIPGMGQMGWSELVLDLNGTLALDGALVPGVAERLAPLREQLSIRLLTADTHGAASGIAQRLGVSWSLVERGQEAEQKQAFVLALGAERTIAIGNGHNDALMLQAATLGIATLGGEGTSARALGAADLVTRDICEALDLLLHPRRLLATLRC